MFVGASTRVYIVRNSGHPKWSIIHGIQRKAFRRQPHLMLVWSNRQLSLTGRSSNHMIGGRPQGDRWNGEQKYQTLATFSFYFVHFKSFLLSWFRFTTPRISFSTLQILITEKTIPLSPTRAHLHYN